MPGRLRWTAARGLPNSWVSARIPPEYEVLNSEVCGAGLGWISVVLRVPCGAGLGWISIVLRVPCGPMHQLNQGRGAAAPLLLLLQAGKLSKRFSCPHGCSPFAPSAGHTLMRCAAPTPHCRRVPGLERDWIQHLPAPPPPAALPRGAATVSAGCCCCRHPL